MVRLQAIFVSCLALLAIDLTDKQVLNAPDLREPTPASTLQPIPQLENQLSDTTNAPDPDLDPGSQVDVKVSAIAREVTVRILGNPGIGSGTIVQRQGQSYTVLTCAHVVAESQDNRYIILTADGQTHNGRIQRWTQFGNADLALVQFRSDRAYRVATIADSKALAIGDSVYAAGFPNWHWANSNAIEETRNWGTRAFRLTSGKVGMLPSKSLQQGYQLGYTNEIEQGMSGGPVLDRYGQLIGINGRLKYPPQGIISFIFADGTVPSKSLLHQMEALSWAIPTATFRQAIK